MAFVSTQQTERWSTDYGRPVPWSHMQRVTREEFDFIQSTQTGGRAHDITLYIGHDQRIAVIAKHHYPSGMFRAPSGGLHPRESLEDGAGREALEETGLIITLIRYLLCVDVRFHCESETILWKTHVFTASSDDATLAPTDHREIREARWSTPSEFNHYVEMMQASSSGGLNYRAVLHQRVAALHDLF